VAARTSRFSALLLPLVSLLSGLLSSSALSHLIAKRTSEGGGGPRGARCRRNSVSPSGGFTSPGSMYWFTPSTSCAA
jgi:hypothetical protein